MEIGYKGKIYNIHLPYRELEDIGQYFDLRYVYDVLMIHEKTGDLRVMSWGNQLSSDNAEIEAHCHFMSNYEILDAWPVITRSE